MGISYHTLYDWIKQARNGNLHLEKRSDSNVSKLEEENEFLAEATAFFTASRQKCAKMKE